LFNTSFTVFIINNVIYVKKNKIRKKGFIKMMKVYIDGLCEPINPGGIATYGYILIGDINEEGYGFVGRGEGMSNNVAEYSGLVASLQMLIHYGKNKNKIIIYSDSKLLVNQMSGKWQARKGLYLFYWKIAKHLSTKFSDLSFQWIPREENTKADQLSRDAFKEYSKLYKQL
jgi:ribonuclease HI